MPEKDAGSSEQMSTMQTTVTNQVIDGHTGYGGALLRWLRGLHAKALLFIGLLVAYTFFMVLVVLNQREVPLNLIQEYQRVQRAEEALIKADIAAFHVITALFLDLQDEDLKAIVQYFSVLRERYLMLEDFFPEQSNAFRQMIDDLVATMQNPTQQSLSMLQARISRSKYELEHLMDENRERRNNLVREIRSHNDRVILSTLALSITGITLMGALTAFFFSRLTGDVLRLQKRVADIVDGYRGPPLGSDRRDELGQLIDGVNNMSSTLTLREQELELQRRKSSHLERLSAVESLVGGIAHEISNPVNCIDGLAQLLKSDAVRHDLNGQMIDNINAMAEYSRSLARLTHDLLAISATRSDTFQLLDLNHLVRSTVGLFQYSHQCESIRFTLDLDAEIPAIHGLPDQLALVVSNLVENAIDALQRTDRGTAEIGLRTSLLGNGEIRLAVHDNGSGMEQEVLSQAFQPFFTTKPSPQGGGLGLALCASIVSAHGGSIRAQSAPGTGTTIEILLPTSAPANGSAADA